MLKAIWSFFSSDGGTDLSLDEAYKILENTENEVEDQVPAPEVEKNEKEFSCFHKSGTITSIKDKICTIDELYEFRSNIKNLEVGSKVSFILYTNKGKINVSNVTIVDDWYCKPINEKCTWCTRRLICKTVEREARSIVVHPGNVKVDLNTIASEFIPIVGDWIELEAKVELDETVSDLFGKVLEIEKLRPLRPRIVMGYIREWSIETLTGAIDQTVFFNEDALASGYLPIIGDRVVTEVIESDQGRFNCRSIKIIPDQQTGSNVVLKNATLPLFETVRDDVYISSDVYIKAKKLTEKHEFLLDIMNISKTNLILLNITMQSNNPQCYIIKRYNYKNVMMPPGKQLKIYGECVTKNMGTTRELILFLFSEFSIGRWITIIVESESNKHYDKAKNVDKGSILIQRAAFKRNNDIVRGRKLAAPPRFISARLPDYSVPQKMFNMIHDFEPKAKSIKLQEELRLLKPCLTANFTFQNYEDKFHTLIHFEEIEELIAMEKYNQNQTCFIKNEDYLMLEIENLLEKRPSLIIGDRILAKDSYNDDADVYEGYIHKISAKHLYLKFAPEFHDCYNGEDVAIMAVASRTTYRRMHQAVGLAVRNLGNSFLFPSKVPLKEPQVIFVYDKYLDDNETIKQNAEKFNPSMQITNTANEITKFANKKNIVKKELSAKVVTDDTVCSTTEIVPDLKQPIEYLNNFKNPVFEASPDNIEKSNLLLVHNDCNSGQFKKKFFTSHHRTTCFKLEWYNKSLNYYQKEAVRNILLGKARPLPYFIFGPPGTGKTVTLVETILQIMRLIPHSRLLVATPSNSAADLIAMRLIDSGILKPGDLIRLVAYRCVVEDMLPIPLIPYCATADIAREGTVNASFNITTKGLTLGCNSAVIGRHRITVGTCSSLGSLFTMGFSKGHFTHIILDEAGQSTEPEVMIPLSLLDYSTGQVILAGDPLQLGPVILSKIASSFGLEETYLERMLCRFPYIKDLAGFPETGGYDPRLVTKLIYNYRSLPDVLQLCSGIFYNKELKPTISPVDSEEARLLYSLKEILPCRTDGKVPGVVFHGVVGENYQTDDCPSWFNPNEASQIFYYVNELYRLGVKKTDIGIMSPYIKQVKQIRALLNEAEFEVPKVGSVEEFQGQEFNVILLSTVRSNLNLVAEDLKCKLGFISSPRRVNVAVSRAQSLMIIVGNPFILSTDPHWRSVIKYCMEEGAYCGCDLKDSDF